MANARKQNAKQNPNHSAPVVPRPRILRIGVILGGNIIDERLVRTRETVSVGQSTKNTFSIPLETLPKEWPLFALENDRYVLRFTDNMDGRLSSSDQVFTIAQLKTNGAQRRGDHWALPLDERSRGKVVMGDMTLLFQFVTAPPLQPRPQLPASVRGTIADRIEPQLAILLLLSIAFHSIVAVVAYNYDREEKGRVARIETQVYEPDRFDEPIEPEIKDVEEVPAETGTETTTTTKTTDSGPRDTKPEDPGGGDDGGDDGPPDDAAIEDAIANTALVTALVGDESSGGRYEGMRNSDQGAALDTAIEDAKGRTVASLGGGGDRRARGPNSGSIGGDKGTRVGGPGPGTSAGPKEEEKVSRVQLSTVEDLSVSSLDPEQVARLIRSRYLAGIKRCHQDTLKKDPTAGGRVTIRFTVAPTGNVSKTSVEGFNAAVDACIKSQASRWRFSAPKDDGQPTSADFVIPLILKPGA